MSDATEVDAADGTGATKREGQGNRFADQEERFTRGTLIGRYVIVDVLGAGGMGIVYTAFDRELDRKVAIKVLQARAGGSESGGQTWLLREAQAMARLAHPNVVAVYDVGAMSGDLVFVAMELVDGVTLRAWLKAKPRTWREVVPVMRAAGAGLAAAHAAGLVHRDFKPDNVLVGNDGRVRVMDFGLARLDGDESAQRTSDLSIEKRSPLSERLTATGAVLGTPAYMAPEIYAGNAADAAADQFAFGVALYESLYRVRPFDRKALVEQRATAPKPPTTANVPTWLERIALKAVALDPKQRFASMEPLLGALAKDPSTTPKRIAIAAVVALAVAGGIAGAIAFHDPAREPCTDAATRLAGVWDGNTRGALEQAFAKVANSTDTMHGTEKTLDAYTTSWVDMRTESCKATRVHGSQSEEVLTLRMACLDERLAEVEALIGLFGTADAKLVQASVGAAQKLSRISDCADVPSLLAPDPLPKDPMARIAAASLHKQLAAARAIYKSSRLDDTLALLKKITPEVTRLDHLPTTAELHLLIGQTLWVMQGNTVGEPELQQAAWSAEAGKADLIKLEAWLQLANLANEASHFDAAAERIHNASAALSRIGTNWSFKVRILDAEALLASRLDDYDKAIAVAAQARDVAAKHTDADSQSYALLVEASILTSAGRARDAVADFKKVLAFQDALGHHRIDVAVTLQSLAGAEMVTGHVDDAIPHLQDALDIASGIYGENNSETARIYSAIGAAQVGKGDLVGGLATHRKALAIAEATVGKDDEIYALMSGQVGYTLVSMQKPKEAMPYLDRALEIETNKLGPANVQVLALMLTKCDILHSSGAMKAAVELCKRTLALGEKSLGKDSPLLFLFLAHTGDTLVDAKQPREADVLLARAQKLGSTNPSDNFAVVLLDAHAVWDLGDHKRAIALAQKARAGFTQLAQTDQAREADDWLNKHH